jgi:hypothetical protein
MCNRTAAAPPLLYCGQTEAHIWFPATLVWPACKGSIMKTFFAIAFASALSLAAVSTSQAAPMAPLGQTSDIVIQVAGGCGAGWHRGPYGGCRRNYARPALHACPRGYHVGPGGRCRANGR